MRGSLTCMANRPASRQDAAGGTLAGTRQSGGFAWLASCPWWICGPGTAAFPARGLADAVPGSLALFGFIGFTVLKIPGGWSNPLYLAPLFVSAVLTYGMFFFVWAWFGALIAFACLAGPYVLAEITGSLLPIRVACRAGVHGVRRQHRVRRHGGASGAISADGVLHQGAAAGRSR